MVQQSGSVSGSNGRTWAIAGIVSGALTLVWSPIIFALLGVALGYVGRRKGAESLGTAAIAISITLFMLVVVLGAISGAVGALV